MADPFFFTKNLSVGYDSVALLRDVALSLASGEIVTLVGPNGSGKTTLLRSVIRQLPLLSGAVYLDGRDTAALPLPELAREVSVLLTERIHPELMTCRDVVAAGRYPYTGRFGVLGDQDKKVLAQVLEQTRVSHLADRYFSQCSDGQKQRVLLARALCQEPRLLVLDEPTAYLDLQGKAEMLGLLQNLARSRELAVLMSLHEVDLAAKVSHRVACIRGDRIERFGPAETVMTPGYIRDLYGIGQGSYDHRTGSLELPRPTGEPRTFVLCGGGTGTAVFRRLQREGTPFAAGVLWENDLDYPAAEALASEIITSKPFTPIPEGTLALAASWIDRSNRVLCTLPTESMTGLAAPLLDLLRRARTRGTLEEYHAL